MLRLGPDPLAYKGYGNGPSTGPQDEKG